MEGSCGLITTTSSSSKQSRINKLTLQFYLLTPFLLVRFLMCMLNLISMRMVLSKHLFYQMNYTINNYYLTISRTYQDAWEKTHEREKRPSPDDIWLCYELFCLYCNFMLLTLFTDHSSRKTHFHLTVALRVAFAFFATMTEAQGMKWTCVYWMTTTIQS